MDFMEDGVATTESAGPRAEKFDPSNPTMVSDPTFSHGEISMD